MANLAPGETGVLFEKGATQSLTVWWRNLRFPEIRPSQQTATTAITTTSTATAIEYGPKMVKGGPHTCYTVLVVAAVVVVIRIVIAMVGIVVVVAVISIVMLN